MKIFDSVQNKRWSGRGIDVRGNSLIILKSARASHVISLRKGRYRCRMVGKKRTGDSKINVRITDDMGEVFANEIISFHNNSWGEFSFGFELLRNIGPAKLEILRNKNVFGSVEIGRIIIDRTSEKTRNVTPRKFSKSRKVKRKELLVSDSELSKRVDMHGNVCIIVPYSIFGGAEIYISNIINNLSGNPNITIAYMRQNPMQNYVKRSGVYHKILKTEDQLHGLLKANNYDYIVYYNDVNIYGILNRMKKKQDFTSKLIEIYHSDFKWASALSNLSLRKNIDQLIAVSESLGKNIDGIKDKRTVIPVGIDLQRFTIRDSTNAKTKLKLGLEKPIIGTVARLSKEKNISYILELAKLMSEYNFVIVGDGPERSFLEAMVEKYKLTNVNLVGFKKNVEHYYNAFDGFVLASHMEGTPISIIEAMASGVPVFTKMVGAIPDMIVPEKNGFEISGIAQNDVNILKNNLFNTGVIEGARKYVEDRHDIVKCSDIFAATLLSCSKIYIDSEHGYGSLVLRGEFI